MDTRARAILCFLCEREVVEPVWPLFVFAMAEVIIQIARFFGVDIGAITLLAAILAAYPVSALYVAAVRKSTSINIKSGYWLICGLS